MEKASSDGSRRGGKVTMRKSIFWKYSEKELLSMLKALAQGHCDLGVTLDLNIREQVHRVRMLMALSNPRFPRRKRKLQQFLKDNYKSMVGVLAYEASMKKNVKRLNGDHISGSSSSSWVFNMKDSIGSLQENKLMNSYSLSLKSASKDSVIDQLPSSLNVKLGCPNKDREINCDRSCIGRNPTNSTCIANHKSPSPHVIDLVHGADYFCFKETNQEPYQLPRRRSKRLLNFIGDRFRESIVRVGPDFQANIPRFDTDVDDDNSTRWLGNCVWPIEGQYVTKTSRKAGKGRPNTCGCVSPGSSDCINYHIKEERLHLQVNLGPVFFEWKLDEMGAEIPNSSKLLID